MIKNTHNWHYISGTDTFDSKFTNQKSIKIQCIARFGDTVYNCSTWEDETGGL